MTTKNPILTPAERHEAIIVLRELPERLEHISGRHSHEQLHTAYLAGEWSVAQIIHHLVDAHINSYIRTKRILAEDSPQQAPFNQESWVTMADEANSPLEISLMILKGIHYRWVALFNSLSEADWSQTGRFRSDGSDMSIDYLLNSYANHSRLHVAQIEEVLADCN